jgi:hypothetical protein
MNTKIPLETLLSSANKNKEQQLELFVLLNLGVLDSIANGALSSSDALRLMYHADNCLFVHKRLRNKTADEIMSRGVQLPDLFDVLPSEAIHREFQRELARMRALCYELLERKRLVA